MSYLYQSSSYHHVSPLSRTSSASSGQRRSSLSRSYSFGSSYSTAGFGITRSPSRSRFGRSLAQSALYYTPPLQSVALQRASPHYSEKFPHVRYSYASTDTGLGVHQQTSVVGRSYYSTAAATTARDNSAYVNSRWNQQSAYLANKPRYGAAYAPGGYGGSALRSSSIDSYRYKPAARQYGNMDDAVDLFKSRCLTGGNLSKYWMTPSAASTRRHKELNLGMSVYSPSAATTSRSYTSRYSRRY